MSVISGNAYWAAITNPNTTFDPDGTWTIDVCNLDKKNLDTIKKDGLTVKNKGDDRGDFITIKRKVRRKDGSLNRAPDLVDGQKRTMTQTLIGNGSKVKVQYHEWETTNHYGEFKGLDFQAMQVLELVEYGERIVDGEELGLVDGEEV